jgi:hypothetical protein
MVQSQQITLQPLPVQHGAKGENNKRTQAQRKAKDCLTLRHTISAVEMTCRCVKQLKRENIKHDND